MRIVGVPGRLIEIHPEWRSYRYFVANDEVIIVEPDTLKIVPVIRVQSRATSPPLSWNEEAVRKIPSRMTFSPLGTDSLARAVLLGHVQVLD